MVPTLQCLLLSHRPLRRALEEFVRVCRENECNATDHNVNVSLWHSANSSALNSPLLQLSSDGKVVREDTDAVKALGHFFESFVGAIYLDSHASLPVVWDVVYRLVGTSLNRGKSMIDLSHVT